MSKRRRRPPSRFLRQPPLVETKSGELRRLTRWEDFKRLLHLFAWKDTFDRVQTLVAMVPGVIIFTWAGLMLKFMHMGDIPRLGAEIASFLSATVDGNYAGYFGFWGRP